MTRRPTRRCEQCRAALPQDAGPNRRFCNTVCRSKHWRRMHRQVTVFQLAVARSIEAMGMAGEQAYVEGRCPVCGWGVSVRKRSDSVYCSKRCRTRAWRQRKRLADGGA
ncbi:hypothetical protein QZH56_36900 (plasmid) [Streptomyces olivoreticuli]|uniref:hypothetical protein n=1 Tax=Streptomyces olivoreticuli TaxID=68246 RepID=UPI002659D4BE|nr:hypothetical protein [Streptomyces olivoreticuli]WKK27833.1 hypothetical protein QZH56_36900 [Streptomyces olivoreticuli]